MKRRLLLSGNSPVTIDEFFYNTGDAFECQTTSMRNGDVMSHVNSFNPDMFVFCVREDLVESGFRLSKIFKTLREMGIPYAIVGSEEACEKFMLEITVDPVMILVKSMPLASIVLRIQKYLDANVPQKNQPEQKTQNQPVEKEKEAVDQNRKKHVTVVDDDPRMVKVIKEFLHDEYDVAVAVSGKIALRFLESKPTDIILLDYMMPEMNGPEVFEQIRKIPQHANTPIVFLTGMSDREKIKQVISLKPQGYLLKPVEKDKVLATIREIIG